MQGRLGGKESLIYAGKLPRLTANVLCLQCLPQISRTHHGIRHDDGLGFAGVQPGTTSDAPSPATGRPDPAESIGKRDTTAHLTLDFPVFYGSPLCGTQWGEASGEFAVLLAKLKL